MTTRELSQTDIDALSTASPAPLPTRVREVFERAGALRELAVTAAEPCTAVSSTASFPFHQTALLKIALHNADEPLRGTAFFISERLLLTAGHNVLSEDDIIDGIQVMPGFNGSSGGPTIDAAHFEASVAYQNSFAFEDDFGVIVLDDAFTHKFFGAHAPSDGELPDLNLAFQGYPHVDLRQVDCRGRVDLANTTADLLFHNIPTFGGNSGGALSVMIGGEPKIVAIHVAGDPQSGLAAGVRMRDPVLDQIRTWLASL